MLSDCDLYHVKNGEMYVRRLWNCGNLILLVIKPLLSLFADVGIHERYAWIYGYDWY